MAQVQRRIVHKQFNSPIALYSDTNIKATLDRELRSLGNGAVGINFADPATTRPGSLAKSAVLAALEEDEGTQSGNVKPEAVKKSSIDRQSRSRVRQQRNIARRHHYSTVDRDTVLKINRHTTRRNRSCVEFQWPPPNESRPHVNTNTQRFDNKALPQQQVAEIKDFFDNYQENVKELWEKSNQWTTNKQKLSDRMLTSSKSAENLKCDRHVNGFICGIDKKLLINWNGGEKVMAGAVRKNQSCSTSFSSSTSNLLGATNAQASSPRFVEKSCCPPFPPSPSKCFYLPEEKFHSNELVVKIRQHFDKSHDKQGYSSGIFNVDGASNENKIGKTKNHNSSSSSSNDYTSDMKHSLEMHRCKNDVDDDGVSTFVSLFNECDQKIFQLNEFASMTSKEMSMSDIFKINETSNTAPPLKDPLLCRVSELQENQQQELIKNEKTSCGENINDNDGGGGVNDLKYEKLEVPYYIHASFSEQPHTSPLSRTITTKAAATVSSSISNKAKSIHHAISDELSGVMVVRNGDERRWRLKHYHCKDLKPIKSLNAITTATNESVDDGKQQQEQEPFGKHHRHWQQQQQQQQKFHQKHLLHNSILMNDDCKLQQYHQQEQMQDEQTSSSSSSSDGTCRDKYCKNSEDREHGKQMEWQNDEEMLKINEISTNNSTFNRKSSIIGSSKNNINLDLYFDKELSAWSSMMMRKRSNTNEIIEIQMIPSNECNSCVKLDNEKMASYSSNNDSTSTNSSDSTPTEFEFGSYLIGTSSPATQRHETTNSDCYLNPISFQFDNKCCEHHYSDDNVIKSTNFSLNAKNKMKFFTDGTYVYGPYNFDLFQNSFYNFIDNSESLKCFDDPNKKDKNMMNFMRENNSFERDMDKDEKYKISCKNNDDVCYINNSDTIRKENNDFCGREKKFYIGDDRLINFMQNCDNISNPEHQWQCSTVISFDAPLNNMTAMTVDAIDLNNSQQFNYERDKIVEITGENDNNFPMICMSGNGDGSDENLSTFATAVVADAQCDESTVDVNEKNSNPDALKINIYFNDDNDISDKIRFSEYELGKMKRKHRLNSNVSDDYCRRIGSAQKELHEGGDAGDKSTITSDLTTTKNSNVLNGILCSVEIKNPSSSENDLFCTKRNSLKRVAWPPPPESSYYTEPVESSQQQQQPQFQPISQQQLSQPPAQQQQQQQQVSQGAFYQPPVNVAPKPSFQSPLPKLNQRPISIHGYSSFENQVQPQPLSPLPMIQTNFSQQQQSQPAPPQPIISYDHGSPRGWSHVAPPKSPGGTVSNYYQKPFQTAHYQAAAAPPFDLEPHQQQSSSIYAQENVAQQISPPQPQYQHQQQQQQQPFMGTPLRKEAPITQRPAPVYQSQPVATTFQGGTNMRGDLKWPPENYKQQAEVENEARRKVALGPAFRPKRVNRDYRAFFAQNALQNTYPGYRVPPGTLHIENGEFL